MKKLASAFLIAAVLLPVLTGCSLLPRKRTALVIGKAEIDNEVFAYYFDAAYTEFEKEGGDVNSKSALKKRAVELCCQYVGTTTEFEQIGMTLNAESRRSISDNSEEFWRLYGGHYAKEGVSKATVGKIETVEQYRIALLLYYYGEGGEYEIPEKDIEEFFDQNYVEFQAIVGYLTTQNENGDTVPISKKEKAALRATFEEKVRRMKNGATLTEVNDDIEVSPIFASVENSAYPEGFLEQVSTLSYNEPKLIETKEYLFLVVRQDAKKGEENNYTNYRTRYIDAIQDKALDNSLMKSGQEYPIEYRDRVMDSVMNKVLDVRQAKEQAIG